MQSPLRPLQERAAAAVSGGTASSAAYSSSQLCRMRLEGKQPSHLRRSYHWGERTSIHNGILRFPVTNKPAQLKVRKQRLRHSASSPHTVHQFSGNDRTWSF
eukprot:335320-Amphidinium_carterae.1